MDENDLPKDAINDRLTLLFRVEVPDYIRGKHSDTPYEYAVYELDIDQGGCIIYGRYNTGWHANASARGLVLLLINEKAELEDRLEDAAEIMRGEDN